MQSRFFKDRVVAYKKDDKYIAVSLDFDLLADGKSISQALDRLRDATIGYLKMSYLETENDNEIYRKAPKKYQNLKETIFCYFGE